MRICALGRQAMGCREQEQKVLATEQSRLAERQHDTDSLQRRLTHERRQHTSERRQASFGLASHPRVSSLLSCPGIIQFKAVPLHHDAPHSSAHSLQVFSGIFSERHILAIFACHTTTAMHFEDISQCPGCYPGSYHCIDNDRHHTHAVHMLSFKESMAKFCLTAQHASTFSDN